MLNFENDSDKFYAYLELNKMKKISNKTLLEILDINAQEEQKQIDEERSL